MIDWLEALVLGAVQGATEFLPVSSSGHLVIGQHLFGLQEPILLFDVVLHVATLPAVLWYYRGDLLELTRQSLAGCRHLAKTRSWTETLEGYPALRLMVLLMIGTIPTVALGIVFQEEFERMYGSVAAAGTMLLVTGGILLSTRLAPQRRRSISELSVADALLIGAAQGLAIAPGISRSGATIGATLWLGVERESAARFSFLLSIPAIVGALLFKLRDAGAAVGAAATTVGFVSGSVTGYACLALLVYLVKRGRLSWFAPYCLLMGLFALSLA